ncbi:hypothetical protein M4951_05940 [Blastopirellula sp. J2-11]|uniref:hypothetical protein n=1 Tax=Blastopirellula sp. J2-11 TaxID=2943192 RepID=UPI0021C5994F|nr:hypothetical protein [Blastopirellula sp. J2-11]UUO07851.1 hypothetical protein M4951_05940 [Blastopirellula sp. J2-11]
MKIWCAALLPLALLAAGCSKSEFEVTGVEGVCVCNGTPIQAGWIQFSPIAVDAKKMPGKSAIGEIQEDGTFRLSTYAKGDGAVVGKHRIRISEPSMPEPGEIAQGAVVPQKHHCKLPKELILEVKLGDANHFVIELVPKSKDMASRRRAYDG